MKQFFLNALFLLSTGLLLQQLAAQPPVQNLAKTGAKGIFIVTGDHIPSSKGPLSGYLIERKTGNDKEFKELVTLKAVTTLEEFKKNAARATAMLPYAANNSRLKLDSIWMRTQATGSLNKVGASGFSLAVLTGLNMIWLDEKVKAGEVYTYRVTAIGESYTATSVPVKFGAYDPLADMHYESGVFIQPQKRLELYWKTYGKRKPVFVETYRREGNTKFTLIPVQASVLPVKDTFGYRLIDTTVVKGRVYEYYVKGYDEFGNAGNLSDTQRIAALDYVQMPLPEKVKAIGDTLKNAVSISWTLREAALIDMLSLYRSTNSLDGFKQIAVLSADMKEFVDEDVDPATPYFYYFEASYKMQGRVKRGTSFAASFSDNKAPAIPHAITATATNDGIRVDWEYNSANTSGFWLYRAERGQPLQLISTLIAFNNRSQLQTYTDTDTLLNGGKSYQYALKAYSTSHLESTFSDTVVARPVRNIPVPRSPMNVTARRSDDKVFIFWDDVYGYDAHVSGYRLVRTKKIAGTKETFATDTITVSNNMYVDSLVKQNETIRYAVITESSLGTTSKASAWANLTAEETLPAPPASVTANSIKTGVQLNWQPPANTAPMQYIIYRYERGQQPVKAATVAAGESVFVDKTATKGKRYFYFLRTIAGDKTESERSNEAGILF